MDVYKTNSLCETALATEKLCHIQCHTISVIYFTFLNLQTWNRKSPLVCFIFVVTPVFMKYKIINTLLY